MNYWKCTYTTVRGEQLNTFTIIFKTDLVLTEEQANEYFFSKILFEELSKGVQIDTEEFYLEKLDELAHKRFLKGLTPEEKVSASRLKRGTR